MPSKSPLRILSDLISEAVTHIDEQYTAASLEFPSIDVSFDAEQPASKLLSHPHIAKHVAIIVAATEQLSVSVRSPQRVVIDNATGGIKPACIHAVLATGVVEILREAGPQECLYSFGMDVTEISKKNGMDPSKLVRILRLLATSHMFREISPNVFAHNRISSVLDTGKPSSDVLPVGSKERVDKYVGTNGVAALADLLSGDFMRIASYIADHLLEPKTSHSHELDATPFNIAAKCTDSYFTWSGIPGNEVHRTKFDVAMKASELLDRNSILQGFPWETLPAGSKIVDVGGGIGAHSLPIAKKFDSFKFIVQDFIINQTEENWEKSIPGCVGSGMLVAQKHNFLTPQPIKDADIFMIRSVIHNWPNKYAIQILRHLREAAVPGKTRLLLIDFMAQHACKGTHPIAKDIPGSDLTSAPEPLLPNFGKAYDWTYQMDMMMMVIQHGLERTLEDQIYVCKEAGWKVVQIYSPPDALCHQVVAEAI